MRPVEPKPAASVVLVRPGSGEPVEVYMIRRHEGMRFLGGYYAFPGGKVDGADASVDARARCRGLTPEAAEERLATREGLPALAFWVAAIRELFEETGVLMARDASGAPIDLADPAVADRVERCLKALMANAAPLTTLLADAGWFYDVAPLRYLSHFITPSSSPIRFTARFFVSPVPPGQGPRLFLEETSEGFWIGARDGYRRYRAGEMAMAEPAEYALGYLAQFGSLDELWAAHHDGRHKFHGILDRVEFYGEGYDWQTATWKSSKPSWHA
ncbi:MAG: NUDIX hydrolase [Candidatus Rokubacteria bacterium]|nr:NUDIX hydrolase [Candidatus Rokubacteria bacterium]